MLPSITLRQKMFYMIDHWCQILSLLKRCSFLEYQPINHYNYDIPEVENVKKSVHIFWRFVQLCKVIYEHGHILRGMEKYNKLIKQSLNLFSYTIMR